MANGFKITEETWKHTPTEQRDWIVFETILAMRDDIESLKAKRWVNSGCAVAGGAIGGFLFSLFKFLGVK